MTVSLLVNGLTFDFDDRWVALKWDDHPAWLTGLNGHADTKAIDIVALRDEEDLWLIEAGDIRGEERRISHRNTRSARREPIEVEFANKVRDTLAASVWAQDRVREARDLVRYLRRAWRGERGKVNVVLWEEGLEPATAIAIEGVVRQRLDWLNPKVRIASTELVAKIPAAAIDGVSVRTTRRRR